MGAVGEYVKAPLVPDVFVAGKPNVAFLCDETDQQRPHQRYRNARGGKDGNEVTKGVYHPDGTHRLAGLVEGGPGTQPDGIDEHTVEVPSAKAQRDVELPLSLMPVQQALQLFAPTVLQLRNVSGELKHGPDLPSNSAARPAMDRLKRICRRKLRRALCC